jgi:hypothetical protein
MDYSATPNLVHLSPATPGHRALRIAKPHGYRVVALTGELWLTQHRRLEDVILRAGESYAIEGPGLALVTAFESSDVEVIPPAGATPGRALSLANVDFAGYERKARRMRAEAAHALFAGAWRALRSLVGGLRAAS